MTAPVPAVCCHCGKPVEQFGAMWFHRPTSDGSDVRRCQPPAPFGTYAEPVTRTVGDPDQRITVSPGRHRIMVYVSENNGTMLGASTRVAVTPDTARALAAALLDIAGTAGVLPGPWCGDIGPDAGGRRPLCQLPPGHPSAHYGQTPTDALTWVNKTAGETR